MTMAGAGFDSAWGISWQLNYFGYFPRRGKGRGVWGKARGILGDNEVDVGKTKDVAHRVEAG